MYDTVEPMKLVKTTNKCLECVCMYVWMYVCMYACVHVCKLCMCVWPLKIDYQFYLLYKFHKNFSIPFVTVT